MLRKSACMMVICAVALTGCAHRQLRYSTVRQGSSLTDIQYRQVLDNVAMFESNPNSLPYFALVTTGNTQITDMGGINALTFNWLPSSGSAALGGSRAVVENWGLIPVVEPDRIEAMRCAYQMLIGYPGQSCVGCETSLGTFLKDPSCEIPTGWYCTTRCRKEIPKGAFYGQHNGLFVWVLPEKMDGLSQFTLSILRISTLNRAEQSVDEKGMLRTSPIPTYSVPRVGSGAQFYPQGR